MVDARGRPGTRGLHDAFPAGRRAARRGDRRDRAGEVEDDLPVDLGRCSVLLVLRRDARRTAAVVGAHRMAGFRELHWTRRRFCDDRRCRAHVVLARALPPALRSRLHRSPRPRPELTRAALRPLTPSAMHSEVVTIGHELLLGYTIDTNAAHLART